MLDKNPDARMSAPALRMPSRPRGRNVRGRQRVRLRQLRRGPPVRTGDRRELQVTAAKPDAASPLAAAAETPQNHTGKPAKVAKNAKEEGATEKEEEQRFHQQTGFDQARCE